MSDSLKIWGTEYTDAKGFKAKDPTGQITFTYLRPQGTKAITQNGTGIDVTEYATVDVNVSGGGSGGTPAWIWEDTDGYLHLSYTYPGSEPTMVSETLVFVADVAVVGTAIVGASRTG